MPHISNSSAPRRLFTWTINCLISAVSVVMVDNAILRRLSRPDVYNYYACSVRGRLQGDIWRLPKATSRLPAIVSLASIAFSFFSHSHNATHHQQILPHMVCSLPNLITSDLQAGLFSIWETLTMFRPTRIETVNIF